MTIRGSFLLVVAALALLLPAQAAGKHSVAVVVEGTPLVAADRYVLMVGQGSVTAMPDTAIVTGGVVSKARTAGDALRDNNEAMAKVVAALKGIGTTSSTSPSSPARAPNGRQATSCSVPLSKDVAIGMLVGFPFSAARCTSTTFLSTTTPPPTRRPATALTSSRVLPPLAPHVSKQRRHAGGLGGAAGDAAPSACSTQERGLQVVPLSRPRRAVPREAQVPGEASPRPVPRGQGRVPPAALARIGSPGPILAGHRVRAGTFPGLTGAPAGPQQLEGSSCWPRRVPEARRAPRCPRRRAARPGRQLHGSTSQVENRSSRKRPSCIFAIQVGAASCSDACRSPPDRGRLPEAVHRRSPA